MSLLIVTFTYVIKINKSEFLGKILQVPLKLFPKSSQPDMSIKILGSNIYQYWMIILHVFSTLAGLNNLYIKPYILISQ